MDNHNRPKRKSQMLLNEAYFWTDTIKDWKRLLQNNDLKMIIINCWQNLIKTRKVKILWKEKYFNDTVHETGHQMRLP